jgi:hypothetical protein
VSVSGRKASLNVGVALQQIAMSASKMPLDGHPEPFLNMPGTPPRRLGVRAPMISTLRTKVGVAARSVEMAALLCTAAAGWSVASAQGAVHEVGIYGDPFAAASYWRQQHTSDCGEMAVADVVGLLTGHEPAEQQITALAETTPSTARPGPIWNPLRAPTSETCQSCSRPTESRPTTFRPISSRWNRIWPKGAGSSSYSTPKPSGTDPASATPPTTSSLSPA